MLLSEMKQIEFYSNLDLEDKTFCIIDTKIKF